MIDGNRVREIMQDSLFQDEGTSDGASPPANAIVVEGTVNPWGFDPERLPKHRDEIVAMLGQLDDGFMDDGGKGLSLMNMVETKDGELWGEQYMADTLFVLAAGLDLAKFTLPRTMWDILPGHMPYITVFRSKF